MKCSAGTARDVGSQFPFLAIDDRLLVGPVISADGCALGESLEASRGDSRAP
jgi:hypothetical protein